MRQRITVLAQAGALCIGLAQNAIACAFHGYTPDPTLVDILMGSEHVILARHDPSNPRRYTPVEALIGTTDAVDIPIPVDADTRSRLQRNPGDAVLFARDGPYGPWVRLAVLDPGYRAVVDTVVARQTAWSLGNDKDRFQIFAARVNDRNPEIRRLALLELDRADYGLLRDLKLPKVSRLQQDLETGDPDLRPIRILLAGLSRDKRLVPALSAGLDAAARRDVPYLGAYATALIELGGAEAVSHILNRHLAPAALSIETREKIIEALAIHSQTGDLKTKRGIRRGVADLLSQSPELAGAFARQFGFRSDWSLSDPLRRAAAARPPTAIADVFAVNQYIGIADRAD
ncbi:MAG: hypothetical protein QNJ44_20600 [Rhodobacter sp.]|nr:hypothetical protein [Rhodobacter sp.]